MPKGGLVTLRLIASNPAPTPQSRVILPQSVHQLLALDCLIAEAEGRRSSAFARFDALTTAGHEQRAVDAFAEWQVADADCRRLGIRRAAVVARELGGRHLSIAGDER